MEYREYTGVRVATVGGLVPVNAMAPCLYIPRDPHPDSPRYWSMLPRDIVRESSRGCCPVAHGIYGYCLLVLVLSESILFTTVLWAVFHVALAPTGSTSCTGESILMPEPLELAYGTALLLSGAGSSVGTVYASRDSTGVYYWNTTSPVAWATLFPGSTGGELGVLGVYTNDSYTGACYLCLSGLHLIHVCWGILVVGASSGTGYSMDTTPTDTIPTDMYSTMDYSYWHMVETVYTSTHGSLYYY